MQGGRVTIRNGTVVGFHIGVQKVIHSRIQPDGNFAVERDGTAEIIDFAGCVFAQVLELFDEGGWFQVCPVFREPGCLRVVPVREIGMFRVLVEGGEHNPDFPEGAAVRPLPFGGQEII